MELSSASIVKLDIQSANVNSSVLSFTDKNITDVEADTFEQYKLLVKIYFAGNKITSLPEDVFLHNVRLREIGLDFNQMTVLPRGLLQSLPELQSIHLNCNMLSDIPRDLFQSNKKLEQIFLQYNYIKVLHPETFANLPELQDLRIDVNKLSSFDFSMLKSSRKLLTLDLAGNNLTEIVDYKKFKTWFPNLQAIDIKNNNFSCSYLKDLIYYFEQANIAVYAVDKTAGISSYSVFGVGCIPDNQSMSMQISKLKREFRQIVEDEKLTLKSENIDTLKKELNTMKQEVVNIRVEENMKMKIDLGVLKKELENVNALWEAKFTQMKVEYAEKLDRQVADNNARWEAKFKRVAEINEALGKEMLKFKDEMNKIVKVLTNHDDELMLSRDEIEALKSDVANVLVMMTGKRVACNNAEGGNEGPKSVIPAENQRAPISVPNKIEKPRMPDKNFPNGCPCYAGGPDITKPKRYD